MNLTDTHAHIYSEQFSTDIDEVLDRTFAAGVTRIYMPNVDHSSIDGMMEMEQKHPGHCIPMMGLHPCSVDKNFEKELYLVEAWLNKRPFAAVGEMGIDLYWDTSFATQQEEAFRIQAELAKKHRLPLVIHCRSKEPGQAMCKVIELLEELKSDQLTGVLHCFSGSVEEAQKIVELGFMLGIGGVLTYKKSGLDQVVKAIDARHLLLETDSPYLAPVPHRGKRNETSYIPLIAQQLADLKQTGLEHIADITNQNADRLFAIK